MTHISSSLCTIEILLSGWSIVGQFRKNCSRLMRPALNIWTAFFWWKNWPPETFLALNFFSRKSSLKVGCKRNSWAQYSGKWPIVVFFNSFGSHNKVMNVWTRVILCQTRTGGIAMLFLLLLQFLAHIFLSNKLLLWWNLFLIMMITAMVMGPTVQGKIGLGLLSRFFYSQ